jgi:hypothetical protein|tara:strand:- start:990 stop:1235 length:246 start_codon:yes stop_codon:yes gene_type:complete
MTPIGKYIIQEERVDLSSFFVYNIKKSFIMERSKLKDIVRSLELMVDALKVEVYSDVDSYKNDEPPKSRLDYDELYDDGSD